MNTAKKKVCSSYPYAPEQKITKDERFMHESMAFEDRMRESYGDDAPLFCDDEELFKLSPAAEVIRCQRPEKPERTMRRIVPRKKHPATEPAAV